MRLTALRIERAGVIMARRDLGTLDGRIGQTF